MRKLDDTRMPTEAERRSLTRLMYMAFCELRALALEGRTQQAKDLAEAFHNIPLLMYRSDFSFKAMHDFLQRYQFQYPGKLLFDSLQEWQKLNSDVASA